MKLSLLSLALIAALSGCASVAPMQHKTDSAVTAEEAAKAASISESWNTRPIFVEGKSSVVLLTPQSLPDAVRNRKVSMELEPGTTVMDMVAVLGKLGITVIISDTDAGKKDFYLPRFNGTVGGLLSAVTRATDVWFTWNDGTIVAAATEHISVSVPQEKTFAEQMVKGLDSLGVKGSSVNWQSGMAMMDLSPSQFRKVKGYLERYTANAAIVMMQVAIVNVTLDQSVKQGVDWSKLQLTAFKNGSPVDLQNWQNFTNPPTTGTTGAVTSATTATSSTTTGTTTSTTTVPTNGVVSAGVAAGAFASAIFTNRFSFQGVFNFLQTYGVTETKQNVMLETIAGNKVELKSLTQIPYVSEIGVTTTAATGAATGNALGSSKTEKADDGITLELTPSFDSAANSVTIDVKLSIKAVISFNQLSAGNQLGTMTQPTTAERSFTDSLRMRPGATEVVGGLTYDSVSNSKGAPVFLSGTSLESQALTVSRQSMFIVIRPTITKLGQVLTEESGGGLDMFPTGNYEPEPAEPVEERPIKKLKRSAIAKAHGGGEQ